jgi:enoyl-CoA hydratase/carnithine racemase
MKTTIDTQTDELLCHVEDGVGVITLNRPNARNALSMQLTPAMRRMIPLLAGDEAIRCIVVTGAGDAFCAGGDVKSMASSDDGPKRSAGERIETLKAGQATLTGALWAVTKPTLAALPGPAAGAGLALALACDMRIAAQSAFVTTGYRNIGLSGDYGITWFLTALLGPSKACELLYLADRISADRCLELGVVNMVVPDDQFRDEVMALARRLAAGPPNALCCMKAHVRRAMTLPLGECLDAEAEALIELSDGEEFRTTVRSFVAGMAKTK